MIQCPKCKSLYVSGPRYRARDGFKSECLVYTCAECGYQQAEPTRDAKRIELPSTPSPEPREGSETGQAARCRDYADTLERAPVHDDMGLSLVHTQCADVLREAATLITSLESQLSTARLPSTFGSPDSAEEEREGAAQ